MNSTTVFAPELNLSTSDPKEALDFVSQHEAQEIPLFTEAIIHRYDETAKEFIIEAESHPYRFTQPAYLEFCHQLGIPERFANKIPNDLLIRCVDEMLAASNEKIRLIVRDQNVIARCQRDTYVATNPREFFQAGEVLFQNHLFREASLSDRGTSILFEPLSGQMIQPNVENPSDQFNVGIAFGLGFQTGLIEAHPYSLRHVCLNVAITRSEVPKYNLVEKLKRKGSSKYY